MVKPKITHKMVRRMSLFMTASFQKVEKPTAQAGGEKKERARQQARDHTHHHTKDGSAQDDATSSNFRQQRRTAAKPEVNRLNKSAQIGKLNPAKG